MCKISCTDLFNFTWVCDQHIKPTETRQLVNTCKVNQEIKFANAQFSSFYLTFLQIQDLRLNITKIHVSGIKCLRM